MSAIVLTVPPTYGYVGLSALAGVWLTTWQMYLVGQARRAAGIKYPQAYAEKAEVAASRKAHVFNCTQRAHANTLESLPAFLLSTLLGGLSAPRTTTALASAWVLSRVLYTQGYITGEPDKRARGAIPAFVAMLGLYGTAVVSMVDLVKRGGGFKL